MEACRTRLYFACVLFIGIMATAVFRKEHNLVAILPEEESCAAVLGKLSQLNCMLNSLTISWLAILVVTIIMVFVCLESFIIG